MLLIALLLHPPTLEACTAGGWTLIRTPTGQVFMSNGADGFVQTAAGGRIPLEGPDLLVGLLQHDPTSWLLAEGFLPLRGEWVHPTSGTRVQVERSKGRLTLRFFQDTILLLRALRTPAEVRIGDTLAFRLSPCDTTEVLKALRWPFRPVLSPLHTLPGRAFPGRASPLALLLRFYKATVAVQQGDLCNFRPTCSTYALQSLQTHGGLLGLAMAFDRLLRDHGETGGERDRYPDVWDALGRVKRWDPP